MIKYRFYPSLLDAFQDYLDADKIWEKYWGSSDNPKISFEDYIVKVTDELIERINRVPHPPIEAADKGTCFNEIVDRINSGGIPYNEAVTLKSDAGIIEANMDDFTFRFDAATCKKAAEYFKYCIPQHFTKATIPTDYGEVELYGYPDEIRGDKVYDIKTTGSYEYGKFASKWQKYVYPYCLIESGDMEGITEFEYTVFVLEKQEPFSAKMYKETYPYNHDEAKRLISRFCCHFIEFLEANRERITDTKIFNL